MTSPTSEVSRGRSMPAWLLSTIFHLFLFILLPFCFTSSLPSSAPDSDRPVAIVMARSTASDTVEYFEEPTADAPAAESASNSGGDPSEFLPDSRESTALVADDLKLPSLDRGIVATEGLVQSPELRVAGRRRLPSGFDPSAILAEEAARRQAIAARGPTTELGLFGSTPAVGRSFVFLIDRSQSMGGQGLGAINAAEKELVRAVAGLQPNHKFQVVAYHHQCVYLNKTRKLLPANDDNKQSIDGFLSGLAAFGSTKHFSALASALNLEPDVIFVLTDGGDPRLTTSEITRIAKLAGGRTSVHCIHFGSGPPQTADNFLRRLATRTGGEYGYVDMRP